MSHVSNNLASQPMYLLERDNKESEDGIPAAGRFLDPENRPQPLKEKIDQAFQTLSYYGGGWQVFTGASKYRICGVDEQQLLAKIIMQEYPARKQFAFLDVGEGNGQCIEACAQFMNAHPSLPEDITIELVGVQGERTYQQAERLVGRCRILHIGSFPIEKIGLEEARDFQVAARCYDVIVTRAALRHLIDPTGTFVQLLNLTCEGGFFLFDAIRHYETGEGDEETYHEPSAIQLPLETGNPFLVYNAGANEGYQFALQRTVGGACKLPLSYVGYRGNRPEEHRDSATQSMTVFKRTQPFLGGPIPKPRENRSFYGTKRLFEFFKQNDLFEGGSGWFPLSNNPDVGKGFLLCCKANEEPGWVPTEEDIEGANLNESGHSNLGTLLHVAISSQNLPLRDFLLQKGVNLNLKNEEGETPLLLALRLGDIDSVQTLMEARADVAGAEALTRALTSKRAAMIGLFSPPLHHAVRQGNFMRTHFLLEGGAAIDELDAMHNSPLNLAIESNQPEIAQLLVARKADVNQPGSITGAPPLHVAIGEGAGKELIATLVDAKADLSRRHFWKTPVELARSSHASDDVIALLKQGKLS